MFLDLLIVLIYFIAVFLIALSGRQGTEATTEEYFLSSRNLKWYSIAISTIATNIQGYQFLGMMGSAYLYGMAQAQLEVNAIQGLWMAAFIFVPLYLRDRVITVTQFIKDRLGKGVGLAYTIANLTILSTVGIGAALFWAAYAAEMVFGEYLQFIHEERLVRTCVLVMGLGLFSAIYTYLGGLAAVVRTDIIQFSILLLGGVTILFVAIHHYGGWSELYSAKTEHLMHMHLPADHDKLPWTLMFGLALLNINYWCANQSVVQRSLAARSLKDAQVGMLVGGLMKYFMAVIIIVPGIALAGILYENPLSDPDQTFPYLVSNFLPTGARGLILCALFASLMSTVDSIFNSLATLWSVDIYKVYINKNATDKQMVTAGRNSIWVILIIGVTMGCILLYAKFGDEEVAFTHTLNELRYYINCGIVVAICGAAFLLKPNHRLALVAFLSTIPLHLIIGGFDLIGFDGLFPNMNYFVRAGWVIFIGFLILAIPTLYRNGNRSINDYMEFADDSVKWAGYGLLASMVGLHWVFS